MQIDEARWRALLDALRNAVDASPAFMLVQTAQASYARARSDLDQFQARGALGRPTVRHPDVETSFARDVAELEQRVATADREVKRIEALQRTSSARRNALQQLVDGVRTWAKAQSPPITLPGDDDAVHMPGFAASAVRVPTPPGREFFERGWQ